MNARESCDSKSLMPRPRITQKEIASKLGLTQAAVSLALARHHSIPVVTQDLVHETARMLGYVPDPYLSGLSAYRKRIRPVHFQATLAWLSNYRDRDGWRQTVTFREYHEGAVNRAGELGYKIEEHWLHAENMSNERAAQILAARNINGLLVAPQPAPSQRMEFPFARFSSVTFGYTLAEPQLNLAALHQFRSMRTVFRQLIDLGYRRPGLALANDSDLRADHNWSAAFWSEQRYLSPRHRIPPLLPQSLDKAAFIKWFLKQRPDVVVAIWPEVYDWLIEAGELIPNTIGLALLSVPDEGRKFSGIWETPRLIGAKAVECLIDMIHRGECGVPEVPTCVLIEGTWVPGSTLRRVSG